MLTLCYHKICDAAHDWNGIITSPGTFKKQMEYLKDTYGFASVEEMQEDASSNKIVLTFDDGAEDNYIHALPIIEKLEIPAIFFISTETLDKKIETWSNELVWLLLEGSGYPSGIGLDIDGKNVVFPTKTVEQRMEVYRYVRKIMLGAPIEIRDNLLEMLRIWGNAKKRAKRTTHFMLSVKQLKALSDSKYATIGCHTVTHRSLGMLSEKEQYEEIYRSKRTLEDITGKHIDQFAYPFGGLSDYSMETVNILREMGFLNGYSTTYKRRNREYSNYEIPRVCIKESTFEDFKAKIEMHQKKVSYYYEETETK